MKHLEAKLHQFKGLSQTEALSEQAEISVQVEQLLAELSQPIASSTPGLHHKVPLIDSADAETTIDEAFAGIQVPDRELDRSDLIKRIEDQRSDLIRQQAENATLRTQVRRFVLTHNKYQKDIKKSSKRKVHGLDLRTITLIKYKL